MKISDQVESTIEDAIKSYNGSVELGDPFENILSFGELVDRLSVVNYKLYTLKDKVMKNDNVTMWVHESQKQEAEKFAQFACVEDVKLCRERSRLKSAIDQKLVTMIGKVLNGDKDAGHNPETKLYGDKV